MRPSQTFRQTHLLTCFYRYGAAGVWVGTRFVASVEAGAPPTHKELVLSAGYDDTVRTLLYSGRPMSVRKTPYVVEWFVYSLFVQGKKHLLIRPRHRETKRREEMEAYVAQGKIPHDEELKVHPERSLAGRSCALYLLLRH